MKKLYLTPIFLVLALFTLSCENPLQENPESFLTTDQFFKSQSDAVAAVNAAYEPFHTSPYYNREFVAQVMMNAEYCNGRGSYFPAGNYNRDTRNIQRVAQVWSVIYESINRANTALANIPDIEMDEALKSRLMAELHFIRALDYYNLVRLWGAVPLKIEPSDNIQETSAPRAPVSEVYDLIISDLQAAEGDLPQSYTGNDIGRATSGAAKTLLADVYLTLEDWQNAANKAKEVIDSGVYALEKNLEDIYGADVITHSEDVFSIKFSHIPGQGTILPAFLHNAGAGYSASGFRVFLGEPQSFLSDWDRDDLRRDFNLYHGEDERFLTEAEPILFRKYIDPNASGAGGHATDFPVIRYTDALFIYAEAISQANGGPNAEALEAVNKIRRRAYGLDINTASAVDFPTGLSAEAFRDSVLLEREKEYVMEAKRWFDMKRAGIVQETVESVGKTFEERILLWPIPTSEIRNNDALGPEDQNPGW